MTRIQRRLIQASIFLLLVAGMVVAQGALHRRRADPNQFTQLIDEPSHFVTGLMIRDYVARRLPGSPIRFAKEYYLHYPKVAFGSWPPLLHIFLGGWMLLLPPVRQSALLFMDVLVALLALYSGWLARRSLPWLPAAGIAVAVWLSPVVQSLDQVVQADLQYGLLSVVCMGSLALWMERPGALRAVCFGLALFGAAMTKNNALFLAIAVPLAILLTRSFRLLRRAEFWLAALPGALAVVVWQYFTLPFVQKNMKGVTEESVPGFVAFPYVWKLVTLVWIGLAPFVLWGIYRRVWVPLRRGRVAPLDAALFALLIGPVAFHSLLPHDVNQRYLLPALPALLIFAAAGVVDLFSTFRIPYPAALAAAALAVAIPSIATPVKPLPQAGFLAIADHMAAHYPGSLYPSMLLESSFAGESQLIAEIAVRDHRPERWLLRGGKILRRRTGTLNNRQTAVVEEDPAEMLRYLKELPVSFLVVSDEGSAEIPDREYVARMMKIEPELFHAELTVPYGPECPSCTIRLYRVGASPGGGFHPERLPQNMPLW